MYINISFEIKSLIPDKEYVVLTFIIALKILSLQNQNQISCFLNYMQKILTRVMSR